jgi:hypothetical protein
LKILDLENGDFSFFSMRCGCFEKSADGIENEGVVGKKKERDERIRVGADASATLGGTDADGNSNWLREIMFKYCRSV